MLVAYNCAVIVVITVSQASIVGYLRRNIATIPFIDAGQVYANIVLNFLFIQRSTLPFQKKYRAVIKKFVLEFHLVHHEYISDFAAKQHLWVNKICAIASKIIQMQLYFGIVSYNVFPLLNNIQAGMFSENRPENRSFVHSVDYIIPFDYKNDLRGYFVVFCYNWYPSYLIPSSMCYYDLLIFIVVFHISGHINILSHSLKNFPQPTYDTGTSNETEESRRVYNDEVFVLLKNIIDHYQIIKEFMKEMSEAFDLTLCSYLAFQQLMCCLLLLECSTMERDAVGRYGMLTLVIFQQLIQTSVIFEVLHTKSDVIGDEVYSLPWEAMDARNRKAILLFLRNVQTPLSLKAGGMVPVGVRTMSTILRTSFSYYLMLSNFKS